MSQTPVQSPFGLLVRSVHHALQTKFRGKRLVVLMNAFHAVDAYADILAGGSIPRERDPVFDTQFGRPRWDEDEAALRAQLESMPPGGQPIRSVTLGLLHHVVKNVVIPGGLSQEWLLPLDVPFPYDIVAYKVGKVTDRSQPDNFRDPIIAMAAETYVDFLKEFAPASFDVLMLIIKIVQAPIPDLSEVFASFPGVRGGVSVNQDSIFGPHTKWLERIRLGVLAADRA